MPVGVREVLTLKRSPHRHCSASVSICFGACHWHFHISHRILFPVLSVSAVSSLFFYFYLLMHVGRIKGAITQVIAGQTRNHC